MEPLSLLAVALATLFSSAAKSVVKDVYDKVIRPRLSHITELKVVMPSGEVIKLNELKKEDVEKLVQSARASASTAVSPQP